MWGILLESTRLIWFGLALILYWMTCVHFSCWILEATTFTSFFNNSLNGLRENMYYIVNKYICICRLILLFTCFFIKGQLRKSYVDSLFLSLIPTIALIHHTWSIFRSTWPDIPEQQNLNIKCNVQKKRACHLDYNIQINILHRYIFAAFYKPAFRHSTEENFS